MPGGFCTSGLSLFYYRPQRSCEDNVFSPVCLSTGGVCLSACRNTNPPEQTHNPREQTPTGSRRLLLRAVRILLECILVQECLLIRI